jgi:UDP-2,3-diacylglucosamine pyrophosphatase LpxH
MLAVWDEIRAEGVRIVLVEGNRDFFLDEPELAAHHDGAFLTYEFDAGPKRFRLTHGDRVNRKDRKYLFWRMISKCGVSRRAARALPRRIAVTIVRKMEARLARTNRRFRYHKPVEALTAEAAKAWGDGVDVLFWGHFHTPWRCASEGRVALVVPAWLETGLGVLVEPSGPWRLVENTLTPPSKPLKMETCPEFINV